jgi:cytochrome b involved in lipid metabolism
MNYYTLEEIKKHKKKSDCWVCIDNHVLDLTKFIDSHPVGPDVILNFAGTDATEMFERFNHSDSAYEAMLKFKIGELKPVKKE